MDGFGHQLPLEWHPELYGYDPYTNTLLPLPDYGAYAYGWAVDYSWNPPDQQRGPMQQNFVSPAYSSSSVLPLGRRPPLAAAQRGRGRGGRHARRGRGRGRRHRSSPPRQHGGPGLLGPDPSSSQRPSEMPDEPSSSQQPPAQVQPPPIPVPLPPENKDDPTPTPPASPSSPRSHVMTPPVSDPVKNSHVDVGKSAANKMDDAQDDVLVGLSGSSTAATDKKRLLPLDPPAAPMKNSDVDMSMPRRDDVHGDVLGLNVYLAKKRLISTKASLATDAEEEAKAAARKKTRLGWGQGLAKYENRYKKDDESAHKLVAHDGATGEPASFHGSSSPPGSKGLGMNNILDDMAEISPYKKDDESAHKLVAHDGATGEPASFHGSSSPPGRKGLGENNSLEDMAEMRVSHVTSAPAMFSKGSSRPLIGSKGHGENNSLDDMAEMRVSSVTSKPALFSKGSSPLTGDLGDPGKNESISSLTEKAASPAEVPSRFSSKHSPLPAGDDQNLMADGDLGDPGKNGSINSLTEKAVFPAEVPSRFSSKHSPLPAGDDQNLMADGGSDDPGSVFPEVFAVPRKGSLPPEDNNISSSSMVAIAVSDLPSSSQGCDAPPDESSMKFTKIQDIPQKVISECSNNIQRAPRKTTKVIVQMVQIQKPKLLKTNVLSDAEPETNELQLPCSNEAVCITKSSSKVKENVPQSVLIANHGDEGNCVAGGSSGQDTVKITFFPDEISAKIANGTLKGDQIRSGARTTELCSSVKQCNDVAKHHSWKATEKKLANSNINDGRMTPSDMKNPNSTDHHCSTSHPCMLTGPAFVEHMMEQDQAMERASEENEYNNVAVVRDDLIQRLRESEAMYTYSRGNEDMVKSKEENPVHSVASKECNGIQFNCNVTAQKGKGIMPSPELNDLNAPPMKISNGAIKTYHLPSSSGCAALDAVHANSSYVAMDIDLNIPLDVTPPDVTLVDLGSSTAEASMDSEATHSDATMEISPSQTTTVTQTAQQQPGNQPGSVMLFGHVIYQAPSTGSTNHTPNQGNQIVVSSSNNMPSNQVVPVVRRRGRGQLYPSPTTTSVWRNSVPNNHQGQQAVLANRILYGASANGASTSTASPLQFGIGSSALLNMMNQQRQQALVNITPLSILRGGVPVVPSPLILGSSGRGAGLVSFNGFNSGQHQWPFPVVDTSGTVFGYPSPFYYPGSTSNQAPATAATMPSTRAPPAAGRGRGGPNSWLSLSRN